MRNDPPTEDIVDALADEFLRRYRAGERPTVAEYLQRYPDVADQIRDLFPSLIMLENLAGNQQHGGSYSMLAGVKRPDVLGDYRILQESGRGGMGIVYEAEQISLGRHVALKVLPFQLISDEAAVQRFHREARAAAKLQHPNIVPVYDFCQGDSVWYYAMQFIHGQSLHEVMNELRRLKSLGRAEHTDQGQLADLATSLLSHGELRDMHVKIEEEEELGFESTVDEAPATEREFRIRQVVDQTFTARAQGSTVDDQSVIDKHPDLMPELGEELRMARLILASRPPQLIDELDQLARSQQDDREPQPPASSDAPPVKPPSSVMSLTGVDSALRAHTQDYFMNVVRLLIPIARALEYAHHEGVIHRDVKPSNLLLDTRGHIWITDFGLAKINRGDRTSTGSFAGTLRYMSPEQIRGRCDERSDVYSLGITLYEMLVLGPAFKGSDYLDLMQRICDEGPAPPRKVEPAIPRDLETIVLTAIERDPATRYQSAKDFADDLSRLLANQEIRARRSHFLTRVCKLLGRHAALSALIAALCSTIGVLVLVLTAETIALNESRRRVERQDQVAAIQFIGRQSVDQRMRNDIDTQNGGLVSNFLTLDPRQATGHRRLDLGPVTSLAWVPSRKRIAAVAGGIPVLLDLDTGELVNSEVPWSNAVRCHGETVVWFGLSDGKPMTSEGPQFRPRQCVLKDYDGVIRHASLASDQNWLATIDDTGKAQLWHRRAGSSSYERTPVAVPNAQRVDFTRDQERLIVQAPKRIHVVTLGGSIDRLMLRGRGSAKVLDIVRSPSSWFAREKAILIVKQADGLQILPNNRQRPFLPNATAVQSWQPDPEDEGILVVGTVEGNIEFWDTLTRLFMFEINISDFPICCLEVPHDRLIIAGDQAGTVYWIGGRG